MQPVGPRFLEQLPLLTERRPLAYAVAILLSTGAYLVRLALDPVFPPGFPFLTFFPAVILCAFLLGRGPGSLAALICGVLAWYFFIPPFDSFSLGTGTSVALLFYLGVVTVDIALIDLMQRANARLQSERERSRELAERSSRLAERNELLFRELQHRVSNNIQMVGAVLSLQKRHISDAAARQALDDAAAKLQLIGRIQRQLYDLEGGQVALDTFLRELADDLLAANDTSGITCRVEAEAGFLLDPDAAIPLALIMAESVANAIEHGFAGRNEGQIDVVLQRREDELELSVQDDGVGLPDGFDASTATSLGLKIANSLARQLGGRFAVGPAPGTGTCTTLTIPVPNLQVATA
jgi:two-component sensor histidine kinase